SNVLGTGFAITLILVVLYAVLGSSGIRFAVAATAFLFFVAVIYPLLFIRLLGALAFPLSLDVVVGWMMILSILGATIIAARRNQWVLIAALIYSAALCLNWPNPNSRYLVPIAPLLIWGAIAGLQIQDPRITRIWPWARPILLTVFIATLILSNLMLFGTDAWIARSGDFYARYEAGLDKNLINICAYLKKQCLNDRDVAVNERYTNMGKTRFSKFGVRATVMLSDLVTKYVPNKYAGDPTSQKSFYNWARRYKVKYYLVQQPISPWRVWHFRLSASLQQSLTHEPVEYESGGWQLYKIVDKGPPTPNNAPYASLINVPEVKNWPRRVPGL
ncbi:MAG TPA: hypothetical protein VL282_11305, partial [Tepidisphaeraceae bacterium]|nr:hypothetical protein [Tepidisphaeraceae bacterium]